MNHHHDCDRYHDCDCCSGQMLLECLESHGMSWNILQHSIATTVHNSADGLLLIFLEGGLDYLGADKII